MAEDYITDRDQEEALLNWWRENWRWILGGIALGLALLFGWRYWQTYHEKRAHQAAEQYAEFQSAINGGDDDKAMQLLNGMTSEFSSTPYAQQARLLLAKSQVEKGKFEDAAPLLRTVMDSAKDGELAQIARLRLARVLLQQGKHEETLKLLNTQKAGEFAAQEREIRGDANLAKGDLEAARAEYAAALADATAQIDRNLVELKLQEAGGDATPEPEPELEPEATPAGE